jgi:lysophospholipase L1-like esterase
VALTRVSAATLVTLFVGGNDVWRQVSAVQFATNVRAIVTALQYGGATVVVGTVPNLSHAPVLEYAGALLRLDAREIESRVSAFNEAIARIGQQLSLEIVDLGAIGLTDKPHYFCADGFHPSADGYEAWAHALWSTLERLLREGPSTRSAASASE